MTNFKPLKDYMFFLIDRINDKYKLSSPFLDVGAGVGDVSLYLAKKGMFGDAAEISPEALIEARRNLKGYPVKVYKKDGASIKKKYKTLLLFDVIEHIKDDGAFIKNISKKIERGGLIIITTPNNPKEWSWDDESYGHYRRYTKERIKNILNSAGIRVVEIWDFTFPFFWLMRRLSLKLLKPKSTQHSKARLTELSALNPYWKRNFLSEIVDDFPFWGLLHKIQFAFKNSRTGHEFLVLGVKN